MQAKNGNWYLVLYNGGTVCDTDSEFDDDSADAVCKQMGYVGSDSWTSGYIYYMQNYYPITLDNLNCHSDKDFGTCSYDFEVSDCSHYNDVYLVCSTRSAGINFTVYVLFFKNGNLMTS